MKVLHTISGLDLSSGGPSFSVYLLVNELITNGIDAEILTFAAKGANNKIISEDYFIKTIKPPKNIKIPFSNSFYKYLKENNNHDIYHGHGLWQFPVHYMSIEARKKSKPYIITPRGMLRFWALEQSKLKKKIALWLYQKQDLNKAACLHATAKIEAEEIRSSGFNNPIAVIPNGLNLSLFPLRKEIIQKSKKTILYLSRIHPKKGIESLIKAWTFVPPSIKNDWEIILAGNGEEKYINQLKRLANSYNLENDIKFVGPKYGQDKIDLFHNADLFVLPTFEENFGMAVAEALAFGLPVITTKGAPWEELNIHNAGWWIDIGVEPLVRALTEATQVSDNERKQMGLNGRKLVEENYSIESVAQKMIQLYEWILYRKEKPRFIYE